MASGPPSDDWGRFMIGGGGAGEGEDVSFALPKLSGIDFGLPGTKQDLLIWPTRARTGFPLNDGGPYVAAMPLLPGLAETIEGGAFRYVDGRPFRIDAKTPTTTLVEDRLLAAASRAEAAAAAAEQAVAALAAAREAGKPSQESGSDAAVNRAAQAAEVAQAAASAASRHAEEVMRLRAEMAQIAAEVHSTRAGSRSGHASLAAPSIPELEIVTAKANGGGEEGRATLSLAQWAQLGSRATAMTTWHSLLMPIGQAVSATLALTVPLLLVMAFGPVAAAIGGGSLAPLADEAVARAIGLASALGTFGVAAWSLKDYVFSGKAFLAGALAKFVDVDEATLREIPVSVLESFHSLLKWSGMVAFLCEAVFQLLAFSIVTWGIAVAFPSLDVFLNPEALSPVSAFRFWVERLFALVDGPQVFGVTLSPLQPNPAAWGFGLAIIFFKIGVFGMIIRLFQNAFALRPEDVSSAWGAAFAGRR